MQAKLLGTDTAWGLRCLCDREAQRGVLPRQHFLSRSEAKGNAVGAGRRMQRSQGRIGIGISQVRNPGVFLHEHAVASQYLQQPGNNPREYGLMLVRGGRRPGMKDRAPVGEAIDAIEHETMEVNIEIGGGAKPLDEGDGAGLGLSMGQAGLVDHKGGQGTVDHLHRGREQLWLGGEQMPEREGKRDDPLADRHLGHDMIDEVGRRLRHAAGATGGTKPSPLTGKRHQFLMGAFPTPQSKKPMGENAAFQKRVELVFVKLR